MKVDNIRPQKIDSPCTTRSTRLAQKVLSGMKVVTPRLNWIPLSSTLGHGVGVLASGQLPYLGYATPLAIRRAGVSRGDDWPLLRGHDGHFQSSRRRHISQVALSRDDVVFAVLEVPVSLQFCFVTRGELRPVQSLLFRIWKPTVLR